MKAERGAGGVGLRAKTSGTEVNISESEPQPVEPSSNMADHID